MKVYNEEKTQVLEEYDKERGYLRDDEIVKHFPAVQAVEEVGHYEIVKVYPNGGKDARYVVDIPAVQAVEEHEETEQIKVYVPYTDGELQNIEKARRIAELKVLLCESDYKAIKFAEGVMSEEEYAPIRAERQAYRAEINRLESGEGEKDDN